MKTPQDPCLYQAAQDRHRAVVESFYADLWNRRDAAKMPELLHDGFIFRGSLGRETRGLADFAVYVDFIHAALGDYRCAIREMIREGDKVFVRMMFSGIHRGEFLGYPPSGRRVEWAGAALFTFVGDKVAELWVLGDVFGLTKLLEANASK